MFRNSEPGSASDLVRQESRADRGTTQLPIFLRAPGNGGNEQNAVAFLQRAGLTAKKTDVFLVEIDVEELADLAALVSHVARQFRESLGQRVKSFGDGLGAAVNFWRAARKTAKSRGNFYSNWHWLQILLEHNQKNLLNLSFSPCRRGAELRVEIRLEGFQSRRNGLRRRKLRRNGVSRLQTVAGDANHGGFLRLDAILGEQFPGDADSYAAGGLRENAFGFRQHLDGVHNLGIGHVFGPP